MSAAFWVELTSIKDREARRDAQIAQLEADLAHAKADLETLRSERKSLRKEMEDLSSKVQTLHALREAIHRDAREILGATRDRIDPSQVVMPPVLKTLGYGKETR
jgi:cell division protein FtsB